MMQYGFLPAFPSAANPLFLFGLLLLCGLIGGELVKRLLRLPRIIGYVLVGMLLGASGMRLLDEKLIGESWIFVDIGLGLILFELGRRLDLTWLVKDRWLLATGLLESTLAFVFIYFALTYFEVAPLYAAVAAAIGVSSSPAVVLLVAQELRAEGQVTERALNLVAVNSVLAFVAATMLLSWIHHEYRAGLVTIALHPVYLLAGSLLLGYAACMVTLLLSRWLGKNPNSHYVLLVALVVLTVSAARMFELSVLLALLALGVMVRNLGRRPDLMAVDTNRIGQMFFVVLFVVSGARLNIGDLVSGGGIALVFILARFAGKSIGILSLTCLSGVRAGSAGLLCLALTPMSVMAMAMVQGTANIYPEFGAKLSAIVLSAVLILELAGPVAVQFALKKAGEATAEAA